MHNAFHNVTSLLLWTKSQLEQRGSLFRFVSSLFNDRWKRTVLWVILLLFITSSPSVVFVVFSHVARTCRSVVLDGAGLLLVCAAPHTLVAEECATEGGAQYRGSLVHVLFYRRLLYDCL